ncbi:MAG TPA: mercury methylation corrinoid protein HgcA [Methanomicrobiales archaeon]|nr:mercury methylation corrinoid protein HgcA [Methanomicrobiales archaeon]
MNGEAGTPESNPAPSPGGSPLVRTTTSEITPANQWDHFLARWGVNRMGHIVPPGLYRLGTPTPESEVFVSANYSLSFDALRSALAERSAYILVLDTKGINVWCAAGKGTFGTDELVRRIALTGLANVVSHRRLILPQLSAPGVSWPDVVRRSGFLVEYAPVRARDLPEYLKTRKATPAMRRVDFPLRDRAVLIPVELVMAFPFTIVPALALWFLGFPLLAADVVLAVLTGTVLLPLLLPILPTKDFSTKGFVLGFLVMLWPAYLAAGGSAPVQLASAASTLLVFPPITAYLALNFTGSTPFTSRTGVKKEIFRYVPVLAAMVVLGAVIAITTGGLHLLRVI